MKKKLKTIAVITLVLLTFASLAGCAYKEHSKKYSDMVGDWLLDCTYVDSKAQPKNANVVTFVTFTSGKEGHFTEMTKTLVPGAVADSNGVIPFTVSTKETSFTVDVSTGSITIKTSDGKETVYDFDVDVSAGNVHLYDKQTGADGKTTVYHYIYRAYLDTEVPEYVQPEPTTTTDDQTQQPATQDNQAK